MKLAACAVGAFAVAFAVDLLAKAYIVGRTDVHVVYHQRPHNLALRVGVSLLTLAVVYVLAWAARKRGVGRLWGTWLATGVMIGGTLANGVSTYIWTKGVPDFIRMRDGWVWNVADFEIALGLMGAAVSVVVNAAAAYARGLRSVRNAIE